VLRMGVMGDVGRRILVRRQFLHQGLLGHRWFGHKKRISER
jgi:hypothetical protein